MQSLRENLVKLAAQAKANNIYRMAEMQVQSDYVLKVLEALGWKSSDWALGTNIGANTGTFSDILLHDKNKHAVLVVECKDARRADKLDGCYRNQTFQEQLYGYCRKQGINWGILTNFVEWRLYNDVQERLYQNKKYAFMDLLWPGANPNSYVDILSDEGLAFLMKFKRTPLCQAKGKVDDDPLYYPVEKQVEDIKARFFAKLKGWRDTLRRELHKNYGEKYDKEQIDLFTQKILDRMIFMEVCHDKDIIGQDVHRAILNSRDDKYHELKKWFKEMDEQFNTELFTPMAIDHFDIDDKVLVPIITELNEIDFSEISVHIIGEVYENYLGEMLRVTKKSGLKVQEHKEQAKRKSQGIYYTPEYIVDYIVKNTVGELVKKAKTEDELKKIKILDPACGSGSFLIKAFDVMYEAYEKLKIERSRGQLETGKDLKIKRLILQHNLYGVDLDDRAVEITKLNLMLKALEGFNYSELKGRKLLPNLNLNIRVGNSLISGQTIEQLAEKQTAPTFPGLDNLIEIKPLLKLHAEFYKAVEDVEKTSLYKQIDEEETRLNRKLNTNLKGCFTTLENVKSLNYQVAFPEVYMQGGFDAVIGNPPWGSKITKDEKTYLNNNFVNKNGEAESHIYFLERSLKLLNNVGITGLITPNTWLAVLNSKAVREYLLKNTNFKEIKQLTKYIFDSAPDITPIILFLTKENNKQNVCKAYTTEETKITAINFKTSFESISIKQNTWLNTKGFVVNLYLNTGVIALFEKTKRNSVELGKLSKVVYGIKTGDNKKYLAKTKTDKHTVFALKTGELSRYSLVWKNQYLWWCNDLAGYRTDSVETPKIIIQYIRKLSLKRRIIAAMDEKGIYYPLNNYSYITSKDKAYSLYYIMGIISSNLINYLYANTYIDYNIKPTYLEQLPIHTLNNTNKYIGNKIIKLVKEMLKLNKTPELRQRHSADIAVIDKEIDELVYGLYGLSVREKQIIEGN